ncbi:MAG: ATP-dependent Clp protease ATP-binding subunit [Clostridium sp.]|nr:ATP-dependent Clp protease ATP-binding subunit [Clostridium sp.]MCM1444473.1 ATP-dependent Clp protease ATP-binding subunit [Candidatus Amulumruptor caecigallinarius]
MFGNFNEEARKVLKDAKKEMYELKHPYVGSEHLFLSILKNSKSISAKLKEYKLDYENFKNEIIDIVGVGKEESNWFLYTPLLKRIIQNAILDSKDNNNGEVTVEHLISSLLEEGEGIAIRIMLGMNVDLDSLYNTFSYKLTNKKKKNKKLLIEELGVDLTKRAYSNEIDPVIGRDKEIKRILEILCRRTKNNPLLIGEAGVGKTAIVEELSRLISIGDVPRCLRNKRIISLDMATTVAGTKYRGEFEERLKKILNEIEDNDDIILFIDEIHTLVGAGGAEGAIDASNIFKPALARNKIKCIGATTINEYKKYIEPEKALDRRFQIVKVSAPDNNTVKDILMKLKTIYEKYHYVKISEEIIDLIMTLTKKYIYDRNEPDKSIDILDEVCSKASLKETKQLKRYNELNRELNEILKEKNDAILNDEFNKASSYKTRENELVNEINNLELNFYGNNVKIVTKEDVAYTINSKTGIPIYELLSENKKIIDKINKDISGHIVGQDKAINEVMNIIKKIKLGFKDEGKCYCVMFTGPSGVGKTYLSKLFSKSLVGENVIKLDMSEYSEPHSVSKILGAPSGYVGYMDNNTVLDEIRNKPYSVLILDEIEKAHPSIINLLFQILDDGKIKDSKGNIVRFDYVTIVMTSNIGFHDINVGFTNNDKSKVITKLKENFSVPFINRIDNIVVFNNLSKDDLLTLIDKKVSNLKNKYKDRIKLSIGKNVVNEILDMTNYTEFGARKVDKIIKDELENIIIDYIIMNKKSINIKTIKNLVTT